MENNRRFFLKQVGFLGSSLLLAAPLSASAALVRERRIGVIGLDTSHSEMFTRDINQGALSKRGYRVVAAYPHGSKDIPSALAMKANIIAAVRKMGVRVVDTIDQLLEEVDFVLLESNDGRVHLEQAKKVIAAKKPFFIDKPMAQNLGDVEQIFSLANDVAVPVFSSSALRFDANVQKVQQGSIGKVLGADVFTYAELEPNHLDLAWYMIHGVEMLYSVMGTGCEKVIRTFDPRQEVVTGFWKDGRIGTIRGIRVGTSDIAGTAFGQIGIAPLGPFAGYGPLVGEILDFFDSLQAPVPQSETTEIFRFMEAAQKSSIRGTYVAL